MLVFFKLEDVGCVLRCGGAELELVLFSRRLLKSYNSKTKQGKGNTDKYIYIHFITIY